jgi:hypothetical protein
MQLSAAGLYGCHMRTNERILEQRSLLRFFGSTQIPPYFHEVFIYFITEMVFLQNVFLAGTLHNEKLS